MKDKCGKYEERLSAYLDGHLPPDEMADVAAHLEFCPACSALLDKMRRLDDLAAGMEPEFDEALLDDLDRRIAANLEESDKVAKKVPALRRAEIVPAWYRYAVVAASIAIVMFVGRMAFKETGVESRRHVLKSEQRLNYQPSPVPIPSLEDSEQVARGEAEKPTAESKMESTGVHAPTAASDEAGPEHPAILSPSEVVTNQVQPVTRSKKGVAPKSTALPEVSELSLDETVAGTAAAEDKDMEVDHFQKSAREELATSVITGRITDAETGDPLPGVVVQVEGTTIGAVTDVDGDYALLNVPSDTYNLVYTRLEYAQKEVNNLAVAPAAKIRADVGMELAPKSIETSIAVEGVSRKAASGKVIAEPSAEKKSREYAITIDSLDALYKAAASGFVVPKSIYMAESSETGTKIERFKALLDSVDAVAVKRDSFQRMESMYFKARANYDLYLQTRKDEYLRRATEFKSALLNMINERLEQDENNDTLLDYKAGVERWRF